MSGVILSAKEHGISKEVLDFLQRSDNATVQDREDDRKHLDTRVFPSDESGASDTTVLDHVSASDANFAGLTVSLILPLKRQSR